MEYTCTFCKKTFNINPAEAASAVIDYTFGKKTHPFKCDNCGKDNLLTKAEYEAAKEAADKPKPVAGAAPKPVAHPGPTPPPKPGAPPPRAPTPAANPAPTAPMTERVKAAPGAVFLRVVSIFVSTCSRSICRPRCRRVRTVASDSPNSSATCRVD